MCGNIYVSFENELGETFELNFEIPANSTAEVWLPCLSNKKEVLVDGIMKNGVIDGHFVKLLIGFGKHTLKVKK